MLLPAGADSLRVHVASVRSSVSEALALVAIRDAGKLTGAYFHAELALLTRDVDKAVASLARARPEADLRPRFAEAAGLASSAASRLRVLGATGARPESVVAGQATLASIQLRVLSLERELEP